MIIKNIGNKIISIGREMLMPDSQIRVRSGMGDNPAIAALAEKGYIKLIDEVDDGKRVSGKKAPEKEEPAKQPAPAPEIEPEPETETDAEPEPEAEEEPAPEAESSSTAEQSTDTQDGGKNPEESTDAAETEAPKRVKRNFKRTTTASTSATPEG